jgi:hypothetical protein
VWRSYHLYFSLSRAWAESTNDHQFRASESDRHTIQVMLAKPIFKVKLLALAISSIWYLIFNLEKNWLRCIFICYYSSQLVFLATTENDFTRHCINISRDGHKMQPSPKILQNFQRRSFYLGGANNCPPTKIDLRRRTF